MADQRIKGQEVQIQLIQGGQVLAAFNAIGSFSDTQKSEKIEQGYLGETTNRHDDIFNGFDGNFNFHMENSAWTQFAIAVRARQRRQQPDLVFNIVRSDLYPNGETFTRTYPDVKFGPLPNNIGGRGDYVEGTIDFSSDEVDDNQQSIL